MVQTIHYIICKITNEILSLDMGLMHEKI